MRKKYDVVIAGAGIGGLVCGCYLVREKIKVLIVEKHYQVGGYCASFRRKGFTFDAGVHYLGAGRKTGEIGILINNLMLKKYVNLRQIDPCDKIILPNHELLIRKASRKTIQGIISEFPKERKKIKELLELIYSKNFFCAYADLKGKTFQNVLDKYLNDEEVKTIFEVLLANLGLPASDISALTAITLYREFIFDGGYYPLGGSQAFADGLAKLFKDSGGDLMLSTEVSKIELKNNRATGVVINNCDEIKAKYVVSNIDATITYRNLVKCNNSIVNKKLDSLRISPSAFAVYLGLNIDVSKILKHKCAVWKFSVSNVANCYRNVETSILKNNLDYVICMFPSLHDRTLAPHGKSVMELFMLAPFKTIDFWQGYRNILTTKMVKLAEEIIPGLSNYVEIVSTATPHTFSRYTGNREGALYGWASTPSQISQDVMPQKTHVSGLYSVGHWSTGGLGQGGIVSTVYSGRAVAQKILKEKI